MLNVHLTNVETVCLTECMKVTDVSAMGSQRITLLLGDENVNVEEDNWMNTPPYRG